MTKTTFNQKFVAGLMALVLFISLGFSLYRGYLRHMEDLAYRNVQVLVNYDDIRQFANLSRRSIASVAEDFKSAGATGVLVKERTLQVSAPGAQNALVQNQDAVILLGNELRKDAALNNRLSQAEGIDPRSMYLWLEDDIMRETVSGHIAAKTGFGAIVNYQGMLLIEAGPMDNNLLMMGVGYPLADLNVIALSGLTISPQIKDWAKETDQSIAFVVEDVRSLPNLNGIYFNDKEIPAYEHPSMQALAKEQSVGFIEFFSSEQKGLETLIRTSKTDHHYSVLRMHSIGADQMLRETTQKNLEQFKLAVAERDIRAVFVSFPMTGNVQQDQEQALAFLETLGKALEDDGHKISSEIGKFNMHAPSILVAWVIGLAAVVGTIYLGIAVNKPLWGYGVAALGLVGWTGSLLIMPGIAKQLMAIYACVLFPSLGILKVLAQANQSPRASLLSFFKASGYSLMGACVQVGLLTESAYVMGIDIFRGVKVVLVAPMLLVLLLVLFKWEKFDIQQIKTFLSKPVNVVSLMALGLLAVVVLVYVRRSGNSGTVSALEITFRQALDQILGVRPRTKEFLVGHPAMLLLCYLGYKKRWIPVLLLGAIGQVSMVNTFSHFHTPIWISIVRTVHGLWIGAIIGMAAILVIELAKKWLPKILGEGIQNG